MKKGIILKDIIPFLLWFSTMLFIAILIDVLLHFLNLGYVGTYLGYVGTFTILISFTYSLKKRNIINFGVPKVLLDYHEYLALAGSIMILVHAGVHMNAILPWLAIAILLINVASGLIGKHIVQQAHQTMKDRKKELKQAGLSSDEMEKELFWDTITIEKMRQWRTIHLPITYFLALLSLIHIIAVLIFNE
ncbi:hypothetical protein [Flavobacterium frigoris]|uniref:DUF4149 domain-containing protein n=1 Tax=Flavobacterium frigoris TaxID=229204 RepID=A0A1H9JW24_FLAFI|nr:hypothetical protein [Flavobacterium frigoris]SEQ91039.1 hypothetical protein SAMN05444355_10577 [Flavobacterium frigoris]